MRFVHQVFELCICNKRTAYIKNKTNRILQGGRGWVQDMKVLSNLEDVLQYNKFCD